MGAAIFLVVMGGALGAAGGYVAGYQRGLVVGRLRSVHNQVVQVDDILSRWRREQGP